MQQTFVKLKIFLSIGALILIGLGFAGIVNQNIVVSIALVVLGAINVLNAVGKDDKRNRKAEYVLLGCSVGLVLLLIASLVFKF